MKQKIKQILGNKNLRYTEARAAVLHEFLSSEKALSYTDIEQCTKHKFDKVTVYRTLKTYTDKGIVHEVIDDGHVVKYGLCEKECSDKEHHDDHIHFKCKKCASTVCMNEYEIPPVHIPASYQVDSVNVLVQGLCDVCSEQK